VIKEFSTWLRDHVNSVSPPPDLVIGGNLQVGFRAVDAPVRCHTILDSGGPADFDLPYKKDMMIQIATRAATFMTARADAWTIYDAIHGTAGWTIGPLVSGGASYKIWAITALAKPQHLGQDEKLNHEYSCNYIVTASPK
jgi:hypothetical protein